MTDVPPILVRASALLQAGQPEQAESLPAPLLSGRAGPIALWAAMGKAVRHQGRAREALAIQQMLVERVSGATGPD